MPKGMGYDMATKGKMKKMGKGKAKAQMFKAKMAPHAKKGVDRKLRKKMSNFESMGKIRGL